MSGLDNLVWEYLLIKDLRIFSWIMVDGKWKIIILTLLTPKDSLNAFSLSWFWVVLFCDRRNAWQF